MSKDLAIVQKVLNTGKGVDALEKVITDLPSIPTADLVTGFRIANTYSKRISTFVDAVKKELVDNATQKGRFIAEGEMDEKGHLYLKGIEEDELKAEKRVTTKFNAEKAKVLLEKKGLMHTASETKVRCLDAEKVYDLLHMIAEGKATKSVSSKMAADLLENAFEVTREVVESKVEGLVLLDQIKLSEVKEIMDVSVQYAVKEVKAVKKK